MNEQTEPVKTQPTDDNIPAIQQMLLHVLEFAREWKVAIEVTSIVEEQVEA